MRPSKDFWSGVGFVIEELALMMCQESMVTIFLQSLSNEDKKELFEIMEENNPDIFNDTIKPIINNL